MPKQHLAQRYCPPETLPCTPLLAVSWERQSALIVCDRSVFLFSFFFFFFFFNDTAPTDISPLSLHDALPIWMGGDVVVRLDGERSHMQSPSAVDYRPSRSEEHTSELQSPCNLVCRLLLE